MAYFLFTCLLALISALVAFKMSWRPLVAGLVTFVVFGVLNYGFMPVLNPWGFDGFWFEITLAVVVGLVIVGFDDEDDLFDRQSLYRWSALFVCLILFGVRCVTSWEIFQTKDHANLLQVEAVSDSTFHTNVHPIPVEKMISVNEAYAKDLASKRIEYIPSLGSRCEFGDGSMINLNGEFDAKDAQGKKIHLSFDNEKVWVLPLEHTGFWKWNKYGSTPGYCIVSAQTPERIFFLTEINGKPLQLKYLSSAYFFDEIERYVRTSGYASYGLTDYSMELDDSGNPYWVITIFEPTIGFAGEDATGVLIVDMQTGDIKEYGIDDAPEWVDLIQADQFLETQIDNWGALGKGYWNGTFGAKDGVRQATPGISLVYSEGRSYWYTGIQSVGADKSTSGFLLIDSRTKETKLYPVSGINEEAAMNIIEAQSDWVRQSKLSANYPVLYNVHGEPTYYMTLTGDGIKNAGYAFVNLKQEQLFAVANTPQKALKEYLKVLQNGMQFGIKDGDVNEEELHKYTVRDITSENGVYYILFTEVKGKEFSMSADASTELKWTNKGNKVEVSFSENDAQTVPLNYFNNLDFEF